MAMNSLYPHLSTVSEELPLRQMGVPAIAGVLLPRGLSTWGQHVLISQQMAHRAGELGIRLWGSDFGHIVLRRPWLACSVHIGASFAPMDSLSLSGELQELVCWRIALPRKQTLQLGTSHL